MLKNNKIKKSKIGSKVTIHRRQKSNGLNILPTTDDQTPTTQMARVSNPGGAIIPQLTKIFLYLVFIKITWQ